MLVSHTVRAVVAVQRLRQPSQLVVILAIFSARSPHVSFRIVLAEMKNAQEQSERERKMVRGDKLGQQLTSGEGNINVSSDPW